MFFTPNEGSSSHTYTLAPRGPRSGEPLSLHLPSIPPSAVVMVLDADVLSVVLRYVDALDKTPRTSLAAAIGAHVVRGGAECRCVGRSWRISTEDVIGWALPPMTSVSLASLLVPGRLRFVLLSCRYHDEHGVVSAYDALVSRAEAVGLRLREEVAQRETVGTSALLAANCGGRAGAMAAGAGESESASGRGTKIGPSGGNADCLCYRVALKRIVGEALSSPAFSWCSTLGPEDARLLEGCVGASSLLQARWYSE